MKQLWDMSNEEYILYLKLNPIGSWRINENNKYVPIKINDTIRLRMLTLGYYHVNYFIVK